jgi:glycosyltransferase involved in cell wall biosynthesis
MTQRCDVIVATRNRPEALARCLESLRDQTTRDFSVIVVDDASDQPAESVLKTIDCGWMDVRIARLPTQSGPAAARNAGVALSSAEFVAFVDDDVRADRRLVETHLAAIDGSSEGPDRTVSCGPFLEPVDWVPTPWNLWEARQAKQEAEAMLQGVYAPTWRQCHTGNNCMARTAFLAAGGFDETLRRAEDDELALHLYEQGCVFSFQPQAIAWHYSERSLEAWLAIPRSYAECDVRIDRLHPAAGYVAVKQRELRERSAGLRLYRSAFLTAHCPGLGVTAAVAVARVLARRRRTLGLSMMALSAAYDLAYVDTLRRELQRQGTGPQASGLSGGSSGRTTVAD